MNTYISPSGNPEVWNEKPDGYFTPEEWAAAHPSPEPVPPTLEAAVLRLRAYETEADELFRQAQFYEAEAKGLHILGQEEAALEAEQKASAFYQQYASKKLEIRAEYPDGDPRKQIEEERIEGDQNSSE